MLYVQCDTTPIEHTGHIECSKYNEFLKQTNIVKTTHLGLFNPPIFYQQEYDNHDTITNFVDVEQSSLTGNNDTHSE